ncbi:MAG TPA: hypothetical protein VHR42_02255, partial [Clostridia bacterium]|nr:hypothetical protein [Clostridia bacterium]
NNGYAAGNNAGLDYLKEKFGLFDYIIISNPDIEVHLQAIEACRDFLENHDTMALAAPRMHGPDGLPHHLSGWKERTFLCDLAYSSGLLSRTVGMYRETYPESYFQGEYSRVDCAAGSFFMIKGPVFYEIGKFDPNTFLYYEEDILGVRIKRAGYEEAVLNRFGFTHFEGTSVNRSLSMVKKYLTMQKSRIYFQRHYRRINFAQLLVLYAATLLGLTEKLVKAVFYRFHDGHPAA